MKELLESENFAKKFATKAQFHVLCITKNEPEARLKTQIGKDYCKICEKIGSNFSLEFIEMLTYITTTKRIEDEVFNYVDSFKFAKINNF